MICKTCGTNLSDDTMICPVCGMRVASKIPENHKDRMVAGILAILLGSLGIHKFYLGYDKSGVIMLLVSLLTFGLGAGVMQIIGIVEGIMYLTKSEEEFFITYEENQKEWF